jgi:hypothetical protein
MFNQLDKGMDKCPDTLATYDSLKIQAEMQALAEIKYRDTYGLSESQLVYLDDDECCGGIGLPQQRAENPVLITYYEICLQNNLSYFIKGKNETEVLTKLNQFYPETHNLKIKYIRTLSRENYEQLKLYASQHPQLPINIK